MAPHPADMGSGTRDGHVTSQPQAYIDTLGLLWQEAKPGRRHDVG